MRKVLKFKFENEDGLLTLPPLKFYKPDNPIVLFARQHGVGHVWVEVSDDGWLAVLELKVFGTGMEIVQPEWEHKASMQDGPWIWHLYGKLKAADVATNMLAKE